MRVLLWLSLLSFPARADFLTPIHELKALTPVEMPESCEELPFSLLQFQQTYYDNATAVVNFTAAVGISLRGWHRTLRTPEMRPARLPAGDISALKASVEILKEAAEALTAQAAADEDWVTTWGDLASGCQKYFDGDKVAEFIEKNTRHVMDTAEFHRSMAREIAAWRRNWQNRGDDAAEVTVVDFGEVERLSDVFLRAADTVKANAEVTLRSLDGL